MKPKTRKILFITGILLIVLSMIIGGIILYLFKMNSVLAPETPLPFTSTIKYWLLFLLLSILTPLLGPLGWIGIILVIIALVKQTSKTHITKSKKHKKLPLWAKSTIIGIIVGAILFLIKGSNTYYCKYKALTNLFCSILNPITTLIEIITYPTFLFSKLIYKILGQTAYVIALPSTFLLEFFLIGLIIGIILEKIKKR